MATKHTPGPWTVQEDRTFPSRAYVHTIVAGDVTVAQLSGATHDDREAAEAQAADARLIAAAPDLLGFARLVAALEDKCRSEGGRHPTYAEWAVLATSIPAIARATGGGA